MTATAAIDSGKYTPNSTVNGKSPINVSGVPLANDNNQTFGTIDLTTALTYSVNTVWAQVAEHVGRQTMTKYMKRFGFYSKPPLDYPPGEMVSEPSVLAPRPARTCRAARTKTSAGSGSARAGSSSRRMQMAMVAAAVANGGTLMEPRLTDRIVNQDGRTVETINPTVYNQVMKP